MSEVYVVHRNIQYEFGTVAGVFSDKDEAIAFALTLDCKNEEISISRWLPSPDSSYSGGDDIWVMDRGRLSTQD